MKALCLQRYFIIIMLWEGFMIIKRIEDCEIKKDISSRILNNLPQWFGIPEALEEYVRESSTMPFWASFNENMDKDMATGFLSIKKNNNYTAEIYVMGIDKEYHRKGIGKALFNECYNWCKEEGFEFLQVKTLDASHPDPFYKKTRQYYTSMGFKPLECFKELWGEANPCLVMIMHIS